MESLYGALYSAVTAYRYMNATTLKRKLNRNLANAGIAIKPGSPAAQSVDRIAKVGAQVVTSAQESKKVISEAVDTTLAAIHEATRPSRKKRR